MTKQMAATSLQMLAASEKFLKKGLEIKISDLHAQLPAGEITGNIKLQLAKDITFTQLTPIAMQPNLAFDIFSMQSDLSIPAELVSDNIKLVSPLFSGMQTGLFVLEGKYLVHRAQTQKSELLLNGKKVAFN